MAKRVLDGEAIWTSRKIAAVEPGWVRAEYSWLHPLAGANGVFEVDARAIWARCYAFNRPEKRLEDVETILAALQAARLLFVWELGTKRWGYWTNSDKPGRLPRRSWQERDARKGKLGPYPPQEELQRFLQNGTALAGTREACKEHGTGVPGSGSGSGSGPGTLPPEKRPQPSEASLTLARLLRARVLESNPKAHITDGQVEKWAREVDLMMRRDGRTQEEIRAVLEWSQRDSFWRTNILSMGKLREKFDQLTLKMNGQGDHRGSPHTALPRSRRETPASRKPSVI